MEALPLPFLLLVAFLGVQRLAEALYSRRNLRRLAEGSAEAEAPAAFRSMVLLHAGLVLLPPLEALLRGTPPPAALMWGGIALFAAAQFLRYWAIRALGRSWNQRAVVDPQQALVTTGPYRFVRHPNYLAVILEFLAVPLAGAAWVSLLLLNGMHAPVLARRIVAEERLLAGLPGWSADMAHKPRLLPGGRPPRQQP